MPNVSLHLITQFARWSHRTEFSRARFRPGDQNIFSVANGRTAGYTMHLSGFLSCPPSVVFMMKRAFLEPNEAWGWNPQQCERNNSRRISRTSEGRANIADHLYCITKGALWRPRGGTILTYAVERKGGLRRRIGWPSSLTSLVEAATRRNVLLRFFFFASRNGESTIEMKCTGWLWSPTTYTVTHHHG